MKCFYAIVFIVCVVGCKSQNKDNFLNWIISEFEKGTDSTYMRIYGDGFLTFDKKKKHTALLDLNTKVEDFMITTKFYYYDIGIEPYAEKYIPSLIISYITLHNDTNEYGHYFDFEKGEYAWRVESSGASSYVCYFDSLGNVLNEQGSILVDRFKDEQYRIMDMFFTTVFYKVDSVVIYNSSKFKQKLETKPYPWFPMMDYVQIDYITDSIFYIETYAYRSKDQIKHVYTDTIYLK